MDITKMSVDKSLRDDLKALASFYGRPMTRQLEIMTKKELMFLQNQGVDVAKLYDKKVKNHEVAE